MGCFVMEVMNPEHRENLKKLSLESLQELQERQEKILKNKNLIKKLPDIGVQLQNKLEKVKEELKLRQDVKELEKTMKGLTIEDGNSEDHKEEDHIQRMCNLEKSPIKDRYKPFLTLVNHWKNSKEVATHQISLKESMTLLSQQAAKLPPEKIKTALEGVVQKQELKEADDSDAGNN